MMLMFSSKHCFAKVHSRLNKGYDDTARQRTDAEACSNTCRLFPDATSADQQFSLELCEPVDFLSGDR